MLINFINTDKPDKKLLINFSALIAGVLLPFSFAPYHHFWLVFPLLGWLLLICVDQAPAIVFKRAWWFSFAWLAHGISWIYYSLHVHGGAPWPFAFVIIALLAMFLALFPSLALYLGRKFFPVSAERQLIIIFPVMFMLAEWFRGYFLTGFSWLQTGYSQIDSWLVGYAALVGGLGVSGIIALVSGLAVLIIIKREYKYSPLAIVFIWLLGFALMQISWTEPTGEKIKVSLIQGNVAQKDKWQPYMHQYTLNMYRDLSRKNWASDLIIWPETAVPDFEHRVRSYLQGIREQAEQHDTDVLLGIFIRDNNTRRYYNSMINLRGGVYRKRHLVPLGEYFPFRGALDFFSQWINIPMSDVDSGPQQQTMLSVQGHKLGISICFEDAFDRDVLRDLPEAAFLVNVSNDAWFETSAQPAQHHQIARMRAVETGRVMLRATNTGLTSIIGPKGEVLAIAPQFERYVLTREVPAYKGRTPYVIWQNYLLVGLSVFGLLVYGLLVRRRYSQQAVLFQSNSNHT
jgi:apolipoprotein N-acyltransferase